MTVAGGFTGLPRGKMGSFTMGCRLACKYKAHGPICLLPQPAKLCACVPLSSLESSFALNKPFCKVSVSIAARTRSIEFAFVF